MHQIKNFHLIPFLETFIMLTKAVDGSHVPKSETHVKKIFKPNRFLYCLYVLFIVMNQPDEENNSPRNLSPNEIPSLRDSEDVEGSEEGKS